MAEIYSSWKSSWKKKTKREWKEYIRKLKLSYRQGDILKKKKIIQKKHDQQEAESSLEESLELI